MATEAAVDPEEFRSRWHNYVDDLDRLKLALTSEQIDVLEDAQDQLHSVVDAAADATEDER